MLKADDEPQVDRLFGFVASRRAGSLVRYALEQDVGEGLQPDRLAVAGGLGPLGHPLHPLRAALGRPERIEGAVGRDLVQPGTDRRAGFEALKATPSGEDGLLEQVLRVVDRPDDPVDVDLELTPVRVGQLAERILLASASTREHLVGHARILTPAGPFTAITVMTSARRAIRRSISLAAHA